ncbi:Prefoldin subunit-domain-containing protein [Bombardia bombarda]|uniref:Prefoldin subunit-domain-containing protein n=1 Tax=Bombardia bombarda TaxID=252184 RepID=A0AA40C4E8_9PEZI|nr:Prefoldin subunit-domain-containing protein [Bombardia bombarda]
MDQPKDHLSDLSRHMQLLEGTVNQLRASLSYWQRWYFEYSALKEEVDDVHKDANPRKELARIRRDFDSELLTKKEINEIFGKHDLREPEKIATLLDRRLDYVEKNIESLQKNIAAEENKLAAANVIANPSGGEDEETGLPITDIVEELDDDDNVIRTRLQTGGDTQPKIVEALKKMGINDDDIPETEADLVKAQSEVPTSSAGEPAKVEGTSTAESAPAAASAIAKPSENALPSQSSSSTRKSVSFSEDTKSGHEEVTAEPTMSRENQKLEQLMQKAKELEAMDLSSAVIPDSESEEDSKLRREMLSYSMSEIGPVVAELQLDDEEDDYSDADWEIEEDEDDDDEDALGRSQHSVITDDYIKRMQELEKRLGVKSAFTVERPQAMTPLPEDGVGRISIVTEPSPQVEEKAKPPREKKAVRFSSQLDIAVEDKPKHAPTPVSKKPLVNPIADVVEKTTTEVEEDLEEEPPKRVSRFKKERKAGMPTAASTVATLPPGPYQVPERFLNMTQSDLPTESLAPEGQTISDIVMERDVSSTPREPDDMDDILLYEAAAAEYNRLRNRIIQKEGGFLQKVETETVELDEEEGGPKRMSKFKAARLARS